MNLPQQKCFCLRLVLVLLASFAGVVAEVAPFASKTVACADEEAGTKPIETQPIEIGSRRELLIDDYLID